MNASILPFPSTSPRALLQPSLHPRGARPYIYPGRCDEYHAPGIKASRNGRTTACAVDAAWSVERVLGRPLQAPAVWPGVAGAAERGRDFAARMQLAPYQQDGAAFLAERDYALLLDGMGIGKSAQAIAAAEARLSLGSIPDPTQPVVLILCPAIVKRHWQREIKRWTGHDAQVLDGLRPTPLEQTRYVICNYDILMGARRRNQLGVLGDRVDLPGWKTALANRFLIAVLDEIHGLRGRKSQRSKAVHEVLAQVPVCWGLTGTLMPNYVRDLWAPVDLLSKGLFGPYWDWAKCFCDAKEGKYGWVDTGADRLDELSARMSYFALGRTAATVGLQLPEKRREIYYVDVHAAAPTVSTNRDDIATRQKMIAGGLRATARAKRPVVVDQVLEALDNKQNVIVGLYLREQAEMVTKAVREKNPTALVFCVHGELSPDGRDAQATNFRQACTAGTPCAFVCTVDSVGLGISLVGADLMIIGDLVPEPHKLLQFEARGHRRGAEKRILVRYLIATGTIDEGVAERVIAKLANIEAALGKELDRADLGQMLGGKTDGLFAKLKEWGARKKDRE